MNKKKFRWLQKITGIHCIHHIRWAYGYKIGKFGIFKGVWVKRITSTDYHNCTITGIY